MAEDRNAPSAESVKTVKAMKATTDQQLPGAANVKNNIGEMSNEQINRSNDVVLVDQDKAKQEKLGQDKAKQILQGMAQKGAIAGVKPAAPAPGVPVPPTAVKPAPVAPVKPAPVAPVKPSPVVAPPAAVGAKAKADQAAVATERVPTPPTTIQGIREKEERDFALEKNPVINKDRNAGGPVGSVQTAPVVKSGGSQPPAQDRKQAQVVGAAAALSAASNDPVKAKEASSQLGELVFRYAGEKNLAALGTLLRDVMQGYAKGKFAYAGRDYQTMLESEFATKQQKELQQGSADAKLREIQAEADRDIRIAKETLAVDIAKIKQSNLSEEEKLAAIEKIKGDYSVKISGIQADASKRSAGLGGANQFTSGAIAEQEGYNKPRTAINNLVTKLPSSAPTGGATTGKSSGTLAPGFTSGLLGKRPTAGGSINEATAGQMGARAGSTGETFK